MPNYKAAFGSFINTADLQGKAVRLTIDVVANEEIKGEHGMEKKLVVRFAGKDKGLVLNRTNADSLAAICNSEDTDDWCGQTVVLFPDKTKFGNKMVDCVRVRAPQANGRAAQVVAPPPAVEEDDFLESEL